jgi:hypothetical protein
VPAATPGARKQSQLDLPAGPAPAPKPAAPAAPAVKGSWTVAVNLDATQHQGDMTVGAERKAQELQQLADQTRGTDVTIVAQETVKNADGSASLKQYVIKDGQVQQGDEKPSFGSAAKDLESFVGDTFKNYPAEKTALIQQSHGNGVNGVSGDSGSASVADTTAAIRNGLDAAGVDKLDTLDFDACLMAQTEVMDDMASVAKNVVASEEVETGRQGPNGIVDGQNLNDSLSALLANPGMDGAQLGNTMVDASSRNRTAVPTGASAAAPDPANPGAYKGADHAVGTSTLANFDTQRYDAYRQSLDGLGTALNQAMADPTAKAAIQQAIADTPRMGASGPNVDARHAERDVKAFTEQLDEAIANGSLPDPTGQIAAATQQTRDDLARFTESYQGDANGAGYDQLGGLGAFLPDRQYLDTARGAGELNGAGQLQAKADQWTQRFAGQPAEDQAQTVASAARQTQGWLDQVRKQLPAEQQGDLSGIEAAQASLAAAQSPADQAAALAQLDAAADAFATSPAGRKLYDDAKQTVDAKLEQTYANARTGDGQGGWDQFTQALRG